MIPKVILAALEEAGGRTAYITRRQLHAAELKQLNEDGVLIRENRYAGACFCPCGEGHLEDVRWIDAEESEQEPYVICSIATPWERFSIDKEDIRLYRINPRMVKKQTPLPIGIGRNTRAERRLAESQVAEHLKELAFRMLALNEPEREKARKKLNGKHLSDSLGIRQNTIGEILNLCGKNPTPNDLAQFFYTICKNADAFNTFDDYAKSLRFTLERLSIEELYHRLKKHIEAIVGKK